MYKAYNLSFAAYKNYIELPGVIRSHFKPHVLTVSEVSKSDCQELTLVRVAEESQEIWDSDAICRVKLFMNLAQPCIIMA